MAEKVLSQWRCLQAQDEHGVMVYFDPRKERLTLRDLTEDEKSVRLDKLSSVSGLIRSDQLELLHGCEGPFEGGAPQSVLDTLWEGTDYE